MHKFDPDSGSRTLSKIYDIGDISAKFVLVMNEDLGERIHIEFLPIDYHHPILYGLIDIDIFEKAVLEFEMERFTFLNEYYPDYARNLCR